MSIARSGGAQTRARLAAAFVGIVMACAVLAAVTRADESIAGQSSPQGLLPTNSTQQEENLGGQNYAFVTEYLFGNHSYLNYSYHGVIFEFILWCWITVDVGYLCGHAIESGGASYAYNFTDGLPTQNPPWQNWIAPDHAEAVQYQQGGTARLCVAS